MRRRPFFKCPGMRVLSILELVVHAFCIALCAIASGFAARSIYVTEFLFDDILDFTPLVLALSDVTILLLAANILFTIFRRQPFLSRISVELIWSGLLWSTWFGTAGYVTWANTCPWAIFKEGMVCQIHPILTIVSFLVGLLLFMHWITLLVIGHQLSEGGQRTWSMSLKELALRVPIAESRPLQVSEEPKFEYDQPNPTALPLSLPPAYRNFSISIAPPSLTASTEQFPSPIYSLHSYSSASPQFGGVSYPAPVHDGGGWDGLQPLSELPDGYEVPVHVHVLHPHERDEGELESQQSSPTENSSRDLINQSTRELATHHDALEMNNGNGPSFIRQA
ncbi:hypothetical protein E1B28_004029 [Marasmius oreades]|uniref:MARVEL domain-containing protein n=1 Tax=Marasmius oreades TaxID=181124 RepID=A0A9P8AC80_9AGAR|nr:uncharacterized protein E1B28_004029 [Marasmius oreades]KAG7096612.1 hypothetical protein E1B28_004029 [Marasmius oreades]